MHTAVKATSIEGNQAKLLTTVRSALQGSINKELVNQTRALALFKFVRFATAPTLAKSDAWSQATFLQPDQWIGAARHRLLAMDMLHQILVSEIDRRITDRLDRLDYMDDLKMQWKGSFAAALETKNTLTVDLRTKSRFDVKIVSLESSLPTYWMKPMEIDG